MGLSLSPSCRPAAGSAWGREAIRCRRQRTITTPRIRLAAPGRRLLQPGDAPAGPLKAGSVRRATAFSAAAPEPGPKRSSRLDFPRNRNAPNATVPRQRAGRVLSPCDRRTALLVLRRHLNHADRRGPPLARRLHLREPAVGGGGERACAMPRKEESADSAGAC